MCDQQSLRPACTYAQSDQSLCWSLEYSVKFKLLNEHQLKFLSLTGGCTGSFEFTLVKMPHCWKSHVMAQMTLVTACVARQIYTQTRSIMHKGDKSSKGVTRVLLVQLNLLRAIIVRMWQKHTKTDFNVAKPKYNEPPKLYLPKPN